MTFRLPSPLLGLLLAALSLAATAQPDKYPSKPVRIVVGFPPGSATDVAARRVALKLTADLGQSFVVENRPGASGNIAGETVAKAAADGYTLYAGTTSEMAINKPGGMKMRFDPARDFLPVGLLFTTNPVLIASNASRLTSLPGLVEAAKARPGQVNWASVNAFQQVVMASFQKAAAVDLNIVYYKGTALAMNDVLGGQIDGMVGYPAETVAHINSGKARALAIAGTRRNPFLPQTPTLIELGYPGLDLVVWGGIFAPAGTPTAIVEQLNQAIVSASNQPDVKDALARTGSEVRLYSVPEFSSFVTAEITKWDRLVKAAGVRLGE
ncbi:Bug family tripartite tricarboxylate transporter substrate binding protein [Variovorax terrae]|uniref:Tripartite tricarboxylate transporter substrate binding protein n=1 Tax=Variovorax terrae TaxID=2923278 RepID=A0A9X1VRY7_9BURK|nr:tripartite tricarboxylate transporter substrate binding protein [Variovorax terrae]MCJ0762701.1 tripartite tricarboxylate transporter substrate binding protein [Variovorax terrae]